MRNATSKLPPSLIAYAVAVSLLPQLVGCFDPGGIDVGGWVTARMTYELNASAELSAVSAHNAALKQSLVQSFAGGAGPR